MLFFYKHVDGHPMIACKHQAKVVYMLSTCEQPIMEPIDKLDKDGNIVMKPRIIKSYNSHMGGVNRQLHSIMALRKSYKWYRKLAIRLILQVALNSHKVFQNYTILNDVDVDVTNDDSIQCLPGRHFPHIKKADAGALDQRPSKPC